MSRLQIKPSMEGGRITVFHLVVIGLSLTLTLGAWLFSINQVEKRTKLRFEAARDQALGLISDRMAKYEDALWAGVAAIESHSGDITYDEWATFAENLRIDQRYPGINGIGVIHFLLPGEVEAYLAEQRRLRPDFRIHPEHDYPGLMPITFIEPEDINAAAIGLDVAHETNRRTAALASRDTGTAQITGPIVLVQDAGKTPGFLFYAPFYAGGPQPDTERRRENALGAVYAPFVVHKLMEGLLAKDLRQVRFSIRDGGEVIYDEHRLDDALKDPDPMFTEEISLDLYGRTWVIDMHTDLAFREANSNAKPTIILIAGLLIETLIISLLFMMSRANKRAIDYADQVTLALREEKSNLVRANAELSAKNEEIERFAYMASHDLKTPIRGISSLAQMIEDDLEDYLSSSSANPEVASNLDLIHDRVSRMEGLTNGIMKLSGIEAHGQEGEPIRLRQIMSEMALDFGLTEDQLTLDGGCQTIEHDVINFRSVLENLVGNAVKYHDGKQDLRIEVSAAPEGDRLLVRVSDNGPGIDPKFHERIFEVFQTLDSRPGGEATGIGLSIVKKAVERHGGTVTLVSELGEGATFRFDWPATPPSEGTVGVERAA